MKLPLGDLVAADEITPQIINPKSDANPLSVSPLIAYYCSLLLIIGIGLVVFCQWGQRKLAHVYEGKDGCPSKDSFKGSGECKVGESERILNCVVCVNFCWHVATDCQVFLDPSRNRPNSRCTTRCEEVIWPAFNGSSRGRGFFSNDERLVHLSPGLWSFLRLYFLTCYLVETSLDWCWRTVGFVEQVKVSSKPIRSLGKLCGVSVDCSRDSSRVRTDTFEVAIWVIAADIIFIFFIL